MKYTITSERIELHYSFYKIIFPNSPSFKLFFIDNRKIIGDLPRQTGLMIHSKEKKYEPWYGIISKIVSKSGISQAPGYIFGLDNIEKFLVEAKERGYNVDDVLGEVLLAKQEKINFFGR